MTEVLEYGYKNMGDHLLYRLLFNLNDAGVCLVWFISETDNILHIKNEYIKLHDNGTLEAIGYTFEPGNYRFWGNCGEDIIKKDEVDYVDLIKELSHKTILSDGILSS